MKAIRSALLVILLCSVAIGQTIPPPGDANGDGTAAVGDVFYLIHHLFGGGPSPTGAGDVNVDCLISVPDVGERSLVIYSFR